MSKTYAITGLRLGYFAAKAPQLLERMRKVLLYTTNNVSSLVQYGAVGALEGSQACIEEFRLELKARRDLFYAAVARAGSGVRRGGPREAPGAEPGADGAIRSPVGARTEAP